MKNCHVCNSSDIYELLKWGKYTINRCNNCKLIFSLPLPSDHELFEFYQGFLFKKPEKWEIEKQTKNRIKEINKFFNLSCSNTTTDKKFLDYGGGTGIVFNTVKKLGLDCYYLDMDKQAADFVRDSFGLDEQHWIKDIESIDIKFDYIFSDNVIEHTKDPVAFINSLYNKLAVGGILIIKTPHASNTESYLYPLITIMGYCFNSLKYNSFSVAVKSYVKRFWHCDPPRHLYSFSSDSLKQIVRRLNIINYEVLFYHIPLFEYSIIKSLISRPKCNKFAKAIFTRIITLPFTLIYIPFELLTKVIQYILVKLNLLTSVGIILKISK